MSKNHFLNTLYLENRTSLVLFINSLIYSKNCNDAEDCLQEVFLIVIRKSKTDDIENHPNIKGWLFSIAKNVVSRFNVAYMKARASASDSAELSEEDFSEQLTEDIIYNETNQEKLLSDMRNELSKSEREIFELRLKKLSNKEIAEILNKSESTVKSTFSRLKPKLRKIIDTEVN